MNPEKKKLMVVIALVVVILGVGAFQVLRGSEPEPTATKKDDAKKANPDATKPTGPKNLGLYPLTVHDPFVPAAFMNEGNPANGQPTMQTPKPHDKPVTAGNDGPKLSDPSGKGFNFGPVPDAHPAMDTAGGKDKVNGVGVPPMPVPDKPLFGYTLVGVVEGAHPAAVFDDGKGNQQLIEIGQSVGPSAKLLSIKRGIVRIKFNAETLTFNVGGNPNAK